MRLFLILAVILAGVAFVAAGIVTTGEVWGLSPVGWLALSFVAFFADLLLGGPDINSKPKSG